MSDLQASRLTQWPWRRLVGLVIVLAGALISFAVLGNSMGSWSAPMQNALLGGLMAAGATALRTSPVLLSRQFSQKMYDALLGFGAGVMLAASAFSLGIPALAAARQLGASRWSAGGTVGAGILLGAGLLLVIDRLVPHEHL